MVLGLAFSIVATFGVVRDSALTKTQRFTQLVLVWVVPFFGPIVTTIGRRAQQNPGNRKDGEPWTSISDGQAITMALAQHGGEATSHDPGQMPYTAVNKGAHQSYACGFPSGLRRYGGP